MYTPPQLGTPAIARRTPHHTRQQSMTTTARSTAGKRQRMKATAASAALFLISSHTAGAGRPSRTMAWITTPRTTATSDRCSSSSSMHPTGRTPFTKALAPRTNVLKAPEASERRRLPSVGLLCSSSTEDVAVPDKGQQQQQQQSLFIFGVGYVATALALTFLRKGWTVHGTCTDPRKVKSLGDQGIKVGNGGDRKSITVVA